MADGVDCELCSSATVEHVRTGPTGIQVWVCSHCGDLKRWCPECNQGWIRRMRVSGASDDAYVCDECEATWLEAPEREQQIVGMSQIPGVPARVTARDVRVVREQG